MKDLDWFPMYAARFLNSRRVRMMDAERVGVYALLLCEQWSGGPIPDDNVKLAFLAHTDATLARGVLEECFELTDEGWINPEMQRIRAEQEEKHDFFVEAGRRGGQAKAANRPTPPISPPYENEFLVFWEVYPKKIGKIKALEAWQARRRSGVTPEELMATLDLDLWIRAARLRGMQIEASLMNRTDQPEIYPKGRTVFVVKILDEDGRILMAWPPDLGKQEDVP